MSQSPFDHSPDLARLCAEGYEVEILAAHLLVHSVPYVTSERTIKRGILVMPLTLAGDIAAPPSDHQAMFAGGAPCNQDGSEIAQIRLGAQRTEIVPGFWVDRQFSAKAIDLPGQAYPDFYAKVVRYVSILGAPAAGLDSTVTAKTFSALAVSDDTSVFHYLDTASARAGLGVASSRLVSHRLAIVGSGGTGSYVLDFVAKTPASEIHLYDADVMLSHNAFRSPGAMSIEALRTRPTKVTHFAAAYSVLRRGIIPHAYAVTAANVHELYEMSFVFLCLDDGAAKRVIVDALITAMIPFIDVGMGLYQHAAAVGGTLATTTVLPGATELVAARISFAGAEPGDEYDQNAQIVELNAMNAALAVIKWKKICGFYGDLGQERYSAYTIETNTMVNDEFAS